MPATAIESSLQQHLQQAFKAVFNHEVAASSLQLQPTRKEFEGTHTFVVFPYLKVSRKKPEETATLLGQHLVAHTPEVTAYQVVKGFLNITLADGVWRNALHTMATAGDYGQLPANGQKVLVEYASPNTNKPLHLGHLRTIFLGYSMSQIMKAAGYEVRMCNLVNDRGIHICKSMLAYLRHGNGETPESAGIKGDHLVGRYYVQFDKDYKVEVAQLEAEGMEKEQAKKEAPSLKAAQELLLKWEAGDEETVALWKQLNGWVYDGMNATYSKVGVYFDQFYYESDTYLLGKDIVDEGLASGVFYRKEDGSVWADLTEEGLDHKLVLRADGTSVYMTQDMGTSDLKYKDFAFDQSIYVVGNEQDYHFKVLFQLMAKIGRSYAPGMYHLSYGMVDLPSGKMKSREGTVVDADELVDELHEKAKEQTTDLGKIAAFSETQFEELYHMLGLGAIKYFLLKVDPKRRMLFNPEESVDLQGNSGPFIQYTHARTASILRRAAQMELPLNAVPEVAELHATELELIYLLSDFGRRIETAAKDYTPAVIANYAYDVAKGYNRFYTEVSIFNEADQAKLHLRVALTNMVGLVIRKSLDLLGIKAPERM